MPKIGDWLGILVLAPLPLVASLADARLADFPRLAGERDDAPRFRRAIDAAANGILEVPKGEYAIATPLAITNRCSLDMHPAARLVATAPMDFLLAWDGDCQAPTVSGPGGKTCGDLGFFIRGGDVDGNGLAGCLRIGNAHRFTLSDVTLHNGRGVGLEVSGRTGGHFRKLVAHNVCCTCDMKGLAGNVGVDIAVSGCHLTDVVVTDYTVGLRVRGSANRLTRCHVRGGMVPPKGLDVRTWASLCGANERKMRGGPSDPTGAEPVWTDADERNLLAKGVPEMLVGSIAFDIVGGDNTLDGCQADTAEIGYNVHAPAILARSGFRNNPLMGLRKSTAIVHRAGRLVVETCAFDGGAGRGKLYEGTRRDFVWKTSTARGGANMAAEAAKFADEPFTNDICLPSALWMLSGTQNDMFVQPFIKRWRPHDDFVRFDMTPKTGAFLRRLNHVASIAEPVEGAVIDVSLVDGRTFDVVKRQRTTLRVGQKGIGRGDVYAQILGDSFTHGQFFRKALLESGAVPNLHLVGLLKCGDGQYNEGRGGWTLNSYFNVPTRECQSYHGYMQPAEGRYWGARAFWKLAWKCARKTQPKGFEPTYSCSRFDDQVGRFDERTGVLLDPQPGDIQFDGDANTMVRWEGTAWQPVDAKALGWHFDYGTYLKMWNLKAPQFLFVLLGLNDFRGRLDADFTSWGERIRIVKESYLNACPNGKFVIAIPCSTCGSIDNAAGDFTPRQNAAMWRFRDWLIRNFDRREAEGYYLLDAGIATDNDHGFNPARGPVTAPYADYRGAETLNVQTGNPHPYPNYPSMGYPFAAFIQYYREK
ncbi:MAG: hypothetical protein ACI4Q3_04680 [Kiritimatiellia bacterium]